MLLFILKQTPAQLETMFARRLFAASQTFFKYATPTSLGIFTVYKVQHHTFNGAVNCESPSTAELIRKLEMEMRARPQASFSKSDTTVIFVIGGPGAGKGTQCSRLLQDFPKVVHLSAGDLLRAEQSRPDSALGSLIISCINDGTIVPMHVTIQLLENAMREHPNAQAFLIDGFPRAINQGDEFERLVCESSGVIYFECPESVMLDRLLRRGKLSGRSDDNPVTIHKRFHTFISSSLPVVDHYLYKVHSIDCIGAEEEVYQRTRKAFIDILAHKLSNRNNNSN